MAEYHLGDVLLYRGLVDDAASHFERTLEAQRRIYGPVNNAVADTLGSLGQVRAAQNRPKEAEVRIPVDGDRRFRVSVTEVSELV